jgi:hypothetical protein
MYTYHNTNISTKDHQRTSMIPRETIPTVPSKLSLAQVVVKALLGGVTSLATV